MAMATSDTQQPTAALIDALKAEGPNITLRMGQAALTLIKQRSIRDGIQVDGSFAQYSDKAVNKSRLKGQALNAAGNAYASSGGKGTYGGLRAAQGMKSDKVNLSYTNRTWTSIRPIVQLESDYRYSVLIGTTDEETSRILLYNLQRYGNFLELTEDEERRVVTDALAEVRDLINRFLG